MGDGDYNVILEAVRDILILRTNCVKNGHGVQVFVNKTCIETVWLDGHIYRVLNKHRRRSSDCRPQHEFLHCANECRVCEVEIEALIAGIEIGSAS